MSCIDIPVKSMSFKHLHRMKKKICAWQGRRLKVFIQIPHIVSALIQDRCAFNYIPTFVLTNFYYELFLPMFVQVSFQSLST